RNANMFVLPTRSEAFGIVFQEAAAAGLPVVAPRLAAIPEIVQHAKTGLLYEPGDMNGLAAALATLIASRELRATLGRAARARVACENTLELYATRLSHIIHGVAHVTDGAWT